MPDSQHITDVGSYAARMIPRIVSDLTDALDASMAIGAERRPGTGIGKLDALWRTHPHGAFLYGAIFKQQMEVVERLLRSSTGMALSIGTLLKNDGPAESSVLVINRALGEAVMRLCYLLDGEIAAERSMARMAAYQLESVEGNLRAASAFGRHAQREAVTSREAVDGLQGLMRQHGIELHADQRRAPFTLSLTIDGQRENLKFDATAAFARYLPDSAWLWELGSGVTHSRGWMLASLLPTVETDAPTNFRDLVQMTLLSFLDLADALCRIAQTHTGVDLDAAFKTTHLRRRGVIALSRQPALSVGHIEYASRGKEPRDLGHFGASFRPGS